MSIELLEKSGTQHKTPAVATAAAAPLPAARPAPAKRPPPPPRDDDEDEDQPGFFRRHRVLLGLAAVAAAVAVYAFSGPSKPSGPSQLRKVAVPINVTMAPPPLPPPPPPPPKVEPPKQEEKMEEETAPVDEPPPEAAPSDPTPAITSNGPAGNDNFGLSQGKGGSGNGSGRKVGGAGSKFGYYAGQVQNSVSAAIRRNSKTKSSSLSVIARIWADETGRVTRATLSGSSGDPAVDAALKNEVLTGLQLQAPPPAGMKMPINLRLTARPPR